ncbi:MAG TPA: hypothetical protein P5234_09345 [Thermoanaerobaculaceae bacterium]|nr:hypothetical protein [Thermoanaerobaculaceae bacterium]HRS16436.1 hypothetical protein [Thermoanaerobaculaceae bacterium]
MKVSSMKSLVMMGIALVLAVSVGAQQRRGGPGAGPKIDTSTAFTVQGEVVAFVAGYGEGMPALVVRDSNGTQSTFVLGPFHYLQAQGFTAQPGDLAEVQGWACTTCERGVVVAQVRNVTRNVTVVLHNADGTPAWLGMQGTGVRRRLGAGTPGVGTGSGTQGAAAQGTGNGPAAGVRGRRGQGACGGPDLLRAATYTGTVKSFAGGAGEGSPTLVLGTSAGDVTIMLSPYRALLEAGYTPASGAQITVNAAPVTVDGSEHWVALSLTDLASGLQVSLRSPETGLPLVVGRGRRR